MQQQKPIGKNQDQSFFSEKSSTHRNLSRARFTSFSSCVTPSGRRPAWSTWRCFWCGPTLLPSWLPAASSNPSRPPADGSCLWELRTVGWYMLVHTYQWWFIWILCWYTWYKLINVVFNCCLINHIVGTCWDYIILAHLTTFKTHIDCLLIIIWHIDYSICLVISWVLLAWWLWLLWYFRS